LHSFLLISEEPDNTDKRNLQSKSKQTENQLLNVVLQISEKGLILMYYMVPKEIDLYLLNDKYKSDAPIIILSSAIL